MSNEFDPYREALVMETSTIWPPDYEDWELAERRRVEEHLHASPEEATELTYIRTHTGFCRQIMVTSEDVARVESA